MFGIVIFTVFKNSKGELDWGETIFIIGGFFAFFNTGIVYQKYLFSKKNESSISLK